MARLEVIATPANHHSAWVSYDVNASQPSANQTTWEGTPGSSLTLRFRWHVGGTGSTTGTANAPDFATVRAMLPGGAQIGADWSVAFPAADTEVTQVFHFDDDPVDGNLDAARLGMVELYVVWGRAAVVAWSVDSRGATTGTINVADREQHARGYARALATLSTYGVSNASLGGTEPASFAFPDSVFQRFVLDAVSYRSVAFSVAMRQSSTDKRTDAGVVQTAAARDYTWNTTATTVAGNGRVNNGQFTVGSTATDVRITTPTNVFGGSADKEYAWAASGHPAGFALSGDNLTDDSRVTVDPRITFSQVMQLNNTTFQTPPTALDTNTRPVTSLGSLIARAVNARSEGQNSLAWTEKLWDNGELISSEASPAKTRSTTSQAQGGQNGWSDAFINWDNQLPTGNWTQKEVITTADVTGLELTNTQTVVLSGGTVDINTGTTGQLPESRVTFSATGHAHTGSTDGAAIGDRG